MLKNLPKAMCIRPASMRGADIHK